MLNVVVSLFLVLKYLVIYRYTFVEGTQSLRTMSGLDLDDAIASILGDSDEGTVHPLI